MVTKSNEAARFNEGKPMYSYIDFRLWADTFEGKDPSVRIETLEDCFPIILNTISHITSTDSKDVYKPLLAKLKFIVYVMSLMYNNLPYTSDRLLDLVAFKDMAFVLEFGAKKYSRNNWRKGYANKFSTADSLLRHLQALMNGDKLDPESGLHHIGHIMCNVMFLTNDLLYVEREEDGANSTV